MDVTIKMLYEMDDDLKTIMIDDISIEPNYNEIYDREVVVDGLSRQAFVIRAKTFYKVLLSHVPQGYDFILSSKLSISGIICNYNRQTQQLFLYNCTQNQIYIEKDEPIGCVFDG